MKALVVKVKYIANYDETKKPVVMLQVAKNLLGRTADDGNESQQGTHLNRLPMRVAFEPLCMSASGGARRSKTRRRATGLCSKESVTHLDATIAPTVASQDSPGGQGAAVLVVTTIVVGIITVDVRPEKAEPASAKSASAKSASVEAATSVPTASAPSERYGR
jgi:hypothetical protein